MKSVLVLKAAAKNSRAYVDATLGVRRAVRELNKRGSSFEAPVEDLLNESTRVLSWNDTAHGAKVRLFSDFENDVMYLQYEAAIAEDLAILTRVLCSHIPTASLDELKQASAREHDATGHGLVRLAFGAPIDVDHEVVTLLRAGLQETDALVRRNAGFAVAVTTWPELVPELAHSIEAEQDPVLRMLLSRYLEVLESVKRP